jgi:RNA polymerase sigma-70 factor, ECF subfamily
VTPVVPTSAIAGAVTQRLLNAGLGRSRRLARDLDCSIYRVLVGLMAGNRRGSGAAAPTLGGPRARAPGGQTSEDAEEVAALRRGDSTALTSLVRRLHPTMVRVARSYVASAEVAEEVAQDTWVAVIEELDRFEGRSSLKTWIFRILTNQAKTRGVRERRTMPFSSMEVTRETTESPVPPESFLEEGHRWAGHWAAPVQRWGAPDDELQAGELGRFIQRVVDELPPAQRAVVALRDGQSVSAEEVCGLLELSEANQRVLLHRGRQRVRAALAEYLAPGGER